MPYAKSMGGEAKGDRKMKIHRETLKERMAELAPREKRLSPLEMIKRTGGVAHPVRNVPQRAVDSMLAVYRERLTYTFVLEKDVASIHFYKTRQEIFFSGHNIKNIQLTSAQVKALKDLQAVLASDEQGKLLFNDYVATLGHLLADNNK